jgi:hypothetical protein
MSQVEDGDLDIRVSMALVLTGRYRDLMEIRALVREKIAKSSGARFIHGTISSVPLYVVKQAEFKRLRELETLENQPGGDKKNG